MERIENPYIAKMEAYGYIDKPVVVNERCPFCGEPVYDCEERETVDGEETHKGCLLDAYEDLSLRYKCLRDTYKAALSMIRELREKEAAHGTQ